MSSSSWVTDQPDRPLLEVADLTVDYAGGVRALDGVGLRIGRGESLGVIGESGSGKSTLLYAIARLLPAGVRVSGRVHYDGRDLLSMGAPELQELRWREISIVFQGAMHALNPVIRVRSLMAEVLRLRAGVRSRGERERRMAAALDLVDVPHRALDAYAHELSGGMRQRVLLAISLLCEPTLVLADEPTTALDVIVQADILDRVAELRRRLGFALVLVSHDLGVVAQHCERIAVMYQGRLVEGGRTPEVLRSPRHPHTARLISSYPSVDRRLDLASLAVRPEPAEEMPYDG